MNTIVSFPLDYVKKRVLQHILKRYISYLVYGEIDENQLAVDLSNGTAEVRDVLLDVNVLNKKISEENLPFELIEAHVDKIYMRILWTERLSLVEVKNSKITLQPKERFESATSMIESMWRSMTSSLHLAEECMMEDINETPPTSEGIKLFAETIELLFSKIQVKFIDSEIRFQYSPLDSPIGIGVIFNIEEISYKDEAGNDPSKEEITDTTKTDKKVYLEHSYRSRTVRMLGVICSTIENTTLPPPQPEFPLKSRTAEIYNQRNCIYKDRINHGHKIIFAHFIGPIELLLRMKRTEDLEGPKVAIDLHLGSLAIFLCPRQMHLLIELIKGINNPDLGNPTPVHYGGKPNTDLDQERMESDLQYLLGLQREASHGLQGGRWSTPPQEEDLPFIKNPLDNFDIKSTASVSMDSSISSSMVSSCTDFSNRTQQKKTNKIDIDPTAEISHFEIHLPLLSIVLLHEEILVQSEPSEFELVPSNVTQMQRTAEKFFDGLNQFYSITRLGAADSLLDNVVELSHLRLIATEIHIEGDQRRTSSALSINGLFDANHLELSECLYVKQEQIEKIKLITFDDAAARNMTANSSLKIAFKHVDNKTAISSKSSPKTEISLNLNNCTIELDISIIDRINELLKFPNIIVHKNKSNPYSPNTQSKRNEGAIDIKAQTPMITVKLRFPKPDFRAPYEKGKVPWWLRCIHSDLLMITFGNLTFHTLIDSSNINQNFTIQNRSVNVWYYVKADSVPVHIAKAGYDDKYTMQDVRCRLQVTIIPDNNNDLETTEQPIPQIHDSMSAGVKNLYDTRKKESGPFSAKKVVHESNTPHQDAQADFRELLLPGEKHEIVNFTQETMKTSKIQIRVFLPTLSLRFTSKNQFELIYNRINNDLLLWKPSFIRFKPKTYFNYGKVDNEGHEIFSLATSRIQDESEDDQEDDDDEDLESDNGTNIFYSTYDTNVRTSSPVNKQNLSTWSLSLDVQQGIVSLWTLARDSTESNNVLPGQNGEILISAEDAKLFLVSEYLGDRDLMFVCMEIYNAQLYHCDMMSTPDQIPPLRDIGTAPGDRLQPTIYRSESGILVNSKSQGGNREMVTLCMKIKASHETHHVKTVTLAAGFNKATLRHRMYNGPNNWISQLIDFCNVQDYPVPGYQAKDIITELYLHFWDAAIDYRPLYLPYRAAITLANLSISSHLATVANTTLLRFIAEEGYLFLSDKCPKTSRKSYYGPVDLKRDYICLIDLGVLEICSKTTDKINRNDNAPRMDMRISNDIINIRCCADSGLALARLIKYVACNGDLTPPADDQQVSSGSNFNSPKHQPTEQLVKVETQEISNITEVQQKEIIDKIKEAVDDEPPPPPEPSGSKESQPKLYSYHGAKLYYFPGEAHVTSDVPEIPLPQVTNELGALPQDTSVTNSDDEFCFIDREADSNILPTEPTVTWLTTEQVRVIEDWYPRIHEKRDPLKTPLDYPNPVMVYTICDMSINWHIYGGNDFETANQKKMKKSTKNVNFSDLTLSQTVSFSNSTEHTKVNFMKTVRKPKSHREWYREGGINRNYDVHIILNLFKIRFVHDTYPDDTEISSRNYLTIYDVEIIDRLKTSEFNKLLHLYETQWRPRRTGYSQFGVKTVFVRPDLQLKRQECAVKIYCEPLKFNIDQDTLLFIVNFAKELAGSTNESEPVSASPKHSHQLPIVSVKGNETNTKKEKVDAEDNLLIFMEENTTTSISSNQDSTTTSTTTIGEDDEEIFFRTLVVAYDIPIKLDYKGKHISMEHGPLTGLLMGLGQLNGSQFYLKEFSYKQGLLGVKKLFMQLFKIWADDIKKCQLQTVLSGVGPINSFVTLICGFRDLFWMPFDQYKKDGRILKGLHRGAASFSTSTAMAALELTTRLIYLIQLTAETAFDMLTPGPSVRMLPKTKSRRKRYGQPKDIREGVHNAVNLFKEGMEETKDNFIEVASREHEQKGYSGAIGGVMRQVPSTVLRPLIYASEATNNVLGGIKHQLVPEARKEADDKYRKDDNDDSNL